MIYLDSLSDCVLYVYLLYVHVVYMLVIFRFHFTKQVDLFSEFPNQFVNRIQTPVTTSGTFTDIHRLLSAVTPLEALQIHLIDPLSQTH